MRSNQKNSHCIAKQWIFLPLFYYDTILFRLPTSLIDIRDLVAPFIPPPPGRLGRGAVYAKMVMQIVIVFVASSRKQTPVRLVTGEMVNLRTL